MTLDQIKEANVSAGHYFFDADGTRFFGILFDLPVYVGRDGRLRFVSSHATLQGERRYSVHVTADGRIIGTEQGLGAFRDERAAHEFAAAQ